MNNTIDYYNKNAAAFVQGTVDVSFSELQDRFLHKLEDNAYILDFGCGSGRDTKAFLTKGYRVDAADGSEEICKIASEYTGINVRQMLFSRLDEQNKYDGVWACSSILHLSKSELKPVLIKIAEALKTGGVFYTCFKYGDFEGERGGRFFSDFTEETFLKYIEDVQGLTIEETWITADARPGREEEKWLNLILRKADIR